MNIEITPHEFPHTFKILETALSQQVFSGAQFGVWSKNKSEDFFCGVLGDKHRETDPHFPQGKKKNINSESLFDISSLTKVMATTTICAQLVERGWIQFDTPIQKYFPDSKYSGIEIRHLLSHTAGLLWWHPFFEEMNSYYLPKKIENISIVDRQKWIKKRIHEIPLARPVGTEAVYSDLSMMLLGFILEEILCEDLDTIFERSVARPIGLKNTFYTRVEKPLKDSLNPAAVATENSLWRGGVLEGVVHDDNCYSMGGYSGHSGLFSTSNDLLRFVQALFQGFLTKKTLKHLWSRREEVPNCTRTLGWDTPSLENSSVGKLFSRRSVGHLGFTGTSLWIDLDKNLAVTLLTNRVYPSRENNKIKELRPLFHEAIIQDWNMLF